MPRPSLSLVCVAAISLLALTTSAAAGPIQITPGPNQISGAGLPGDIALSDGSSLRLTFTGQLTAATLVLGSGNAPSLQQGAFTAEINGIQIGHAFRSLNGPTWSFALTNQMLTAANLAGYVDVRFDFAGSYNSLRFDTLQIAGQSPGGLPVPEPTTAVLFGLGLVGIAAVIRRRRAS